MRSNCGSKDCKASNRENERICTGGGGGTVDSGTRRREGKEEIEDKRQKQRKRLVKCRDGVG